MSATPNARLPCEVFTKFTDKPSKIDRLSGRKGQACVRRPSVDNLSSRLSGSFCGAAGQVGQDEFFDLSGAEAWGDRVDSPTRANALGKRVKRETRVIIVINCLGMYTSCESERVISKAVRKVRARPVVELGLREMPGPSKGPTNASKQCRYPLEI